MEQFGITESDETYVNIEQIFTKQYVLQLTDDDKDTAMDPLLVLYYVSI